MQEPHTTLRVAPDFDWAKPGFARGAWRPGNEAGFGWARLRSIHEGDRPVPGSGRGREGGGEGGKLTPWFLAPRLTAKECTDRGVTDVLDCLSSMALLKYFTTGSALPTTTVWTSSAVVMH